MSACLQSLHKRSGRGCSLSTKLIDIIIKLQYCNLIPDGSDVENVPGTKRVTGEEGWTKIKACQLDAKSSRALKENLNVEKGREPMLILFYKVAKTCKNLTRKFRLFSQTKPYH